MTKQELAAKIWDMANKMRSKIRASEYKDYILALMFYKFLSDNELEYLKNNGFTQEEIEECSEELLEYTRDALGYAISYKNLFSTWKAMGSSLNSQYVSKGLDDFNRNINTYQKDIYEHLFDKLYIGLSKFGETAASRDNAIRAIIGVIDEIPISATHMDTLGYIYEFFIYKFATTNKDDGAFYTPHEVSKLIARLIAEHCKNKKDIKVYDPTSGSGGLLLTIGDALKKYVEWDEIRYYAQELNEDTCLITKMNLLIKGVKPQNMIIRNADTLGEDWPYFDANIPYEHLCVDAVASNPPYSLRHETASLKLDARFKSYGIPPESKMDYAFLLHNLYHLTDDGIAVIVLPHGVLFRGGEEYTIRKNLVKFHNIETIIGLPANLFYATGIPTLLMVLKKNRTNDDILFVDASQCYTKESKQNVLRESDIQRIFDAVIARKDIKNFAKLVSYEEIEKNDFNLNIPRYVNAKVDSNPIDFAGLMSGDISSDDIAVFDNYWKAFPTLESTLFENTNYGYKKLRELDTKNTVLANQEVQDYIKNYKKSVQDYNAELKDCLLNKKSISFIEKADKVKEKLFEIFGTTALVDVYAIYELWANKLTLIESDAVRIEEDNEAVRKTEPNYVINKDKEEVQKGEKGTIFSFDLVGDYFFKDAYEEVKVSKSKMEEIENSRTEIFDSLDDTLKEQLGSSKGFTEAKLKKYLKTEEIEDEELKENLTAVLENFITYKTLKNKIGDKEKDITKRIIDKIHNLTDEEVNTLLEIKWILPVITEIEAVAEKLIADFAKQIDELKDIYGNPLSEIRANKKYVERELVNLIAELEGSQADMKGLQDFASYLMQN